MKPSFIVAFFALSSVSSGVTADVVVKEARILPSKPVSITETGLKNAKVNDVAVVPEVTRLADKKEPFMALPSSSVPDTYLSVLDAEGEEAGTPSAQVVVTTIDGDVVNGKHDGVSSFDNSNKENQQYTIKKGATYRSGVAKWLWQDGADLIAWDQSLNSYLDSTVTSTFDVKASGAKEALTLLTSKNPIPFYLGKTTLATGEVVAAVHSFSKPQIHLTSGRTLQEAVTALAVDYGWKFVPDSQWLVTDDFEFPTNYPVVTELGDIETALLQILDGFPVRAQVLHSTKQIFIVEDRENDE